jgi:hypothetical protein
MRRPNSVKRGEFLPPPFFIAAVAIAIIFSSIITVFAEVISLKDEFLMHEATNKYPG